MSLGPSVRDLFIFWPGVLVIISVAEGVREAGLLMSESSLSLSSLDSSLNESPEEKQRESGPFVGISLVSWLEVCELSESFVCPAGCS